MSRAGSFCRDLGTLVKICTYVQVCTRLQNLNRKNGKVEEFLKASRENCEKSEV